MDQPLLVSKKNSFFLPLSIVIAGVIIAGAVLYDPNNDLSSRNAHNPSDASKKAAAVLEIGKAPVLGEAEAPITMIIYGDYQCPFCKNQIEEVEKRLRKEFVDTGKLKIAFKHFPLENIHPNARPAAIAANCAYAQNKFWQYHDELYKNQDQLSEKDFDFIALAGKLGLDKGIFASCLNDPVVDAAVTADLESGIGLGIRGTPASFVNNVYIEGAYPYSAFEKIINEQLAKTK